MALVVEEHEIEVARRTDRERRIVTGLDAKRIRRPAQVRLIPLERDDRESRLAVRRDEHRLQDRHAGTRVEIVESNDRRLAAVQVRAGVVQDVDAAEVVLVRLASLVASRRKVRDAIGINVVGRLRDDSVLEHGFGEVNDVVDDDLGTRGGEPLNALGEVELAVEGSMKEQRGARRDVMDDLPDPTAFVDSAGTTVAQDVHVGGQLCPEVLIEARVRRTGLERRRVAREAVREDADRHPGSVHTGIGAGRGAVQRDVALRHHCAFASERGSRKLQRRERADLVERCDRHAS